MLTLHLAPVFKARGIDKPFSHLVKAGMSSHAAHKLLSNTVRAVRLDHIEFLCKLLVCSPMDLLVWTPAAGEKLDANHPLQKLVSTNTVNNWKETLATLPLEKVKELTNNLVKQSES